MLNKKTKILNFLRDSFNKTNKKHIFIRIPKTGGNSLQRSMKENWGHYSAEYCKSIFSEQEWENSFKFTIVRNPYSRLVSWYHYNILKYPYNTMSFKEWVMNDYPHHLNHDYETNVQPENPVSQLGWITNNEGEIIVDYYGKIENIENSIKEISNQTTIKFDSIGRLNKSNHKGYKSYYDDTTINKVAKDFKKELELFNYNFEDE